MEYVLLHLSVDGVVDGVDIDRVPNSVLRYSTRWVSRGYLVDPAGNSRK